MTPDPFSAQRTEFGDFQTPDELAGRVCRMLRRRGVRPRTILEPTCGSGAFLCEAGRVFSDAEAIVGSDLNAAYIREAQSRLEQVSTKAHTRVTQGDFFVLDWPAVIAECAEPVLVLGNPPWVCNSELGAIGGENGPRKNNARGLRGIDAITGKSNFDVSHWMLNTLTEALSGRDATLAMLCKTSVARKTLQHAWKKDLQVQSAAIFEFDATSYFGVSVDACLLLIQLSSGRPVRECSVFGDLEDDRPARRIGFHGGRLISHLAHYRRWKHLDGPSSRRWRSGIKHDCAKVMELKREGSTFRNGLGDSVEIEDTFLYPLLKSSHLAKGVTEPNRWMLVPQRLVGQDTGLIREQAPKTWRYLMAHADRLDARASVIYRKRPRFSIFGVGGYSFAPWKVAISGFYKRLVFSKLGSVAGKPIVFDDTCYFLPCDREQEADELVVTLNSPIAREYLSSLIFWDAKRPITAEILQTLDPDRLAEEVRRR
ncbi:MAG: hypothetical protein ACC628_02500 [Pirellulaceae bacterium]